EQNSEQRNQSIRYQPARPLNKIRLADFKASLETRGNNQGTDLIKDADPVLQTYEERLLAYERDDFASQDLHTLFARS
ncbi:MAG: hypothetical protein AAGA45_07260, partial [Verrucomicrobiota bacterium]